MEEILKTITTKKGAKVSLVQPDHGQPFFRYEAGASALVDSFRYIIRQHGQEDTATVTVNVELPVEENTAQQQFMDQAKGFFKCLEKAMDGTTATMALTNMLGIDEGEPLNDDWLDKVFQDFRYFEYAMDDGVFDFKEHRGRYLYQPEGYWNFEPGGNEIAIYFPSSPDAKGNDALVLAEDYKDDSVETRDGKYKLPTSVKVSLSIGEKPYFSFLLNGRDSEFKTEYHQGTGLPVSFDTRFTVAPYLLQVAMKHDDYRVFYPTVRLSDQDGCKVSLEAVVQINQDLNEDIQEQNIFIEKASLQINELTFTNLGSIWEAGKAKVETQADIDQMMDVQCLYQGQYLGKVRFLIEQEALILEYEDGTSQNLNDLFTDFMKRYFEGTKPDGSPRNKAFDFSNDQNYRSMSKAAASVNESSKKASSKLAEGFKRRFSRGGVSAEKVINNLMDFMREDSKGAEGDYKPEADAKEHYPPGYEEEMKRQQEELEKVQKEAEERAAKAAEEEQRKAQERAEKEAEAEREKREQDEKKSKAAAEDLNKADAKAADVKKEEEKKKASSRGISKSQEEAKAKAEKEKADEKAASKSKTAARSAPKAGNVPKDTGDKSGK